MLRAIAAFELRYQLRSPVFWVGCLIFFLLTFGSITVDQVQIGFASRSAQEMCDQIAMFAAEVAPLVNA